MSGVIEQSALTVVAPIREGAEGELDRLLRGFRLGPVDGVTLDLRKVKRLHFGRFVILPAIEDPGGTGEARLREQLRPVARRAPRRAVREERQGVGPHLLPL